MATNAAGPIARFAQQSGYSFRVLRRVDAGRSAAGNDHSNSYSILQRAQLLEGFGPLQRRRFPADEAKKQFPRVTVDALVTQIQRQGCWNWRAREIEGLAFLVQHDLYLIRGFGFTRIVKRMRSRNHLEFFVALQFPDETIDQLRIDQRLIGL